MTVKTGRRPPSRPDLHIGKEELDYLSANDVKEADIVYIYRQKDRIEGVIRLFMIKNRFFSRVGLKGRLLSLMNTYPRKLDAEFYNYMWQAYNRLENMTDEQFAEIRKSVSW